MKKNFNLILGLILLIFMYSCNNQEDSSIKATKNGIGVLAFGSNVNELPSSVEGMYDRIDSEYDDFEGTTIYQLYQGDDLKYRLMTDNEIINIEVYDSNVDFGGFKVGDSMSEILAMNPAQQITNSGLEMTLNGVFLGINGSLNDSGRDKYSRAYAKLEQVTLNESDFTNSATLNYVIFNKDRFISQADTSEADIYEDSPRRPMSTSEIIFVIVMVIIYIIMGIHMFFTYRKNNCERVFTGSYWRMGLFAAFGSGPIWNGEWLLAILTYTVIMPIFLTLYYYANKTPMPAIMKRGYVRSGNSWLGQWNRASASKANYAYTNKLARDYNTKLADFKNSRRNVTEAEISSMESEYANVSSEISAEESKPQMTTATNLVIYVIGGIIYIAATPFVMVFSYLKNYVYYNRKKVEKMNQ